MRRQDDVIAPIILGVLLVGLLAWTITSPTDATCQPSARSVESLFAPCVVQREARPVDQNRSVARGDVLGTRYTWALPISE